MSEPSGYKPVRAMRVFAHPETDGAQCVSFPLRSACPFRLFSEATGAAQAGAKRAELLVAWAGLEATLRRAAFHAGRRGKIGTQPVVLLRELVAEGQLTAPEHRMLEHLRQLRMSAAHGVTPVAFPPDKISHIKTVSDRLLATTTYLAHGDPSPGVTAADPPKPATRSAPLMRAAMAASIVLALTAFASAGGDIWRYARG
jgi:hypothetical protein